MDSVFVVNKIVNDLITVKLTMSRLELYAVVIVTVFFYYSVRFAEYIFTAQNISSPTH